LVNLFGQIGPGHLPHPRRIIKKSITALPGAPDSAKSRMVGHSSTARFLLVSRAVPGCAGSAPAPLSSRASARRHRPGAGPARRERGRRRRARAASARPLARARESGGHAVTAGPPAPRQCVRLLASAAVVTPSAERTARRAIQKHGFYTPAVAAGNQTAPPISKGSRRPLTKSGMVCKATKGYALHQWMTGRKSPLLIHPTTNGEDNLQDPQPTPDPGAAFLHRPWCPPRYALHDRRCPSATGASARLLENAPRCCSVAPRLRRAGETRARAARNHEQRPPGPPCTRTGVWRAHRDRSGAWPRLRVRHVASAAPAARRERRRAAKTTDSAGEAPCTCTGAWRVPWPPGSPRAGPRLRVRIVAERRGHRTGRRRGFRASVTLEAAPAHAGTALATGRRNAGAGGTAGAKARPQVHGSLADAP
jgi:hypothetical protein